MKKIEAVKNTTDKDYYAAAGPDGILRCSAGYALHKDDDDTYRCEGGYHSFRFDEGEIIHDKFGNVLLKRNSEVDEKEEKK